MLSTMRKLLESSESYQDKIMYMTSLRQNLTLSADNDAKKSKIIVDRILSLLSSFETRYLGLQLLELTLQQNSQITYTRGRWVLFTIEIIKDVKASSLEKQQACKVLVLLIPHLTKDASFDAAKEDLIKDIFPLLIIRIDENVEWAYEASICLKMCLQSFPSQLAIFQINLLQLILHQASYCVSSKSFEVLAECFSELPNCVKDNSGFKDRWKELYLSTLKTIESLLVASLNNEPYSLVGINAKEFIFKEDNGNFCPDFAKRVRRLVNLCRCLAKLLSLKSRCSVTVPVCITLKVLLQLFAIGRKDTSISTQQETLFIFIPQMRLAGIKILESLILNCCLEKHSDLMNNIIRALVDTSRSPFALGNISDLRIETWSILSLYLDGYGLFVSKDISDDLNLHIIEELLADTSPIEYLKDSKTAQPQKKSKKDINQFKRNISEQTCIAALNSLDSVLSAGLRSMSKEKFQLICTHVFKICDAIEFSGRNFPFPYDIDSCREKLYSVVLTIVENLKPEDNHLLKSAVDILYCIDKDPSYKVKKLHKRAFPRYFLQFYPNREFSIVSDAKKKQQLVSNHNIISVWSSEEYTPNIKIENVAEASENVNIDQSFTSENEVEVHSEEFMELETHYPEQVIENQCNGEDLEIQTSSQCQDDVDSDDEEEEEEEERSIADEEINQEEPQQEIYIPTTRKVQTSSPVQINTEIVQSTAEPEYEQLAPSIKLEENVINSSNKDKCFNGERNIMHDENIPSSSALKTNENGIFTIDEDDLDEENEEEEEENCDSFPADKRVESYDQPPSKKQKVEAKDDTEVDGRQITEISPSFDEMKSDFVLSLPDGTKVKKNSQ